MPLTFGWEDVRLRLSSAGSQGVRRVARILIARPITTKFDPWEEDSYGLSAFEVRRAAKRAA